VGKTVRSYYRSRTFDGILQKDTRLPSCISTMVRMFTREEMKELFKEARSVREMHHGYSATLKRLKNVLWISKHYDMRSWISTRSCAFPRDGMRRKRKGHHALHLGRYPVHVVSLDLNSFLGKNYLT